MNRLTTVLYPSLPGIPGLPGPPSDGSSSSITPDGRTESPLAADPQYPLAMNSMSIYDDPRSATFPPPGDQRRGSGMLTAASYASVATPSSANSASASSASSRPSLFRRLTDENNKSSAARRSVSPSPSRKADRGLKVNLMQVGQAKGGKNRRAAVPSPTLGGRLTSMAKGPCGRFVVGGGQYLRVLEIINPTDDGAHTPSSPRSPGRATPFARGSGGTSISEVVNFWKRSWGAAKGVNDLDWGVSNFDSKIVTATRSGNFMIFDINRNKLERDMSGGSPRSMKCIRLHKNQSSAHLLLTGGTEGQVRLWDLRDSEPASRKFYKHNAPITALTFSPDDPHSFVVGTEAGGMLRYDYRVPNKSVGKVWGAHGSRPVMDLKWKAALDEYGPVTPGRGWLASAGGDRTVQIWDMSQTWDKVASPTHTLHAAHAVQCVDWRPNHPTELIVVSDFQALVSGAGTEQEVVPDECDLTPLEVWDVRRHHVAKYAIPGLEGDAVAAIWDDADTLVACYQNGGLVQRDLASKTATKSYPLEILPRQVSAWSHKGEMAYAIDQFKLGEIPFDDIKPEFSSWQVGSNRQRKAVSDAPYVPRQTVGIVSLPDDDDTEFVYMANHYRLEGDTPEMLCRWNREVAAICDRPDEARIWDHLQGLLEEFGAAPKGLFNEGVFNQSAGVPAVGVHPPSPRRIASGPPSPTGVVDGIVLERVENVAIEDGYSDSGSERDSHSSIESEGPRTPKQSRFKSFMPPVTAVPSALRPALASRGDSAHARPGSGRMKRIHVLDTPVNETDGPTPIADMDYPDPYGIAAALESIAQQPNQRRVGASRSTPHSTCPPTPVPADRKALGNGRASGHVTPVVGSQRPSIVAATMDRIKPAAITRRAQESFPAAQWEQYRTSRYKTFLNWWQSYVDDGEVQVATTLFVVGAAVVPFPPNKAERVFEAYLDLLERYHLNIPVAYLRRYSELLNIQTLPSHEGITHVLHCAKCGKSTGSLEDMPGKRQFWWCRKCLRAAKICVVCRQPVKGLWMGCNRCRHGGHQTCMRTYYLETEEVVPHPDTEPSPPLPSARTPGQHSTPLGGSSAGTGGTAGTGNAGGTAGNAAAQMSAIVGEASLESGFTERNERSLERTYSEVPPPLFVSTNSCPSGCGCQCRKIQGHY